MDSWGSAYRPLNIRPTIISASSDNYEHPRFSYPITHVIDICLFPENTFDRNLLVSSRYGNSFQMEQKFVKICHYSSHFD
jgi:hypothetical protein